MRKCTEEMCSLVGNVMERYNLTTYQQQLKSNSKGCMSIRINHRLIIENPFVFTPESSFRTGSSSSLPLAGGRLEFQPSSVLGGAQEFCWVQFWSFLLWPLPWWKGWKGRAAPRSSSISRQFMAPLSGHLPPAELCRWTWPSISFGQEKKEHYWKGLTFPSPCSVVMVLL